MLPRELNVADLPTVVFGKRSPMWWATAGIMLVEGVLLAITVAAYFYLASRNAELASAGHRASADPGRHSQSRSFSGQPGAQFLAQARSSVGRHAENSPSTLRHDPVGRGDAGAAGIRICRPELQVGLQQLCLYQLAPARAAQPAIADRLGRHGCADRHAIW